MISYKSSHVLAIVVILLGGCSKVDKSYFPLNEGLKWRYAVTKTTMDGTRQQKYIFLNLPVKDIDGQSTTVRKTVDGTLLYYRETAEGILFLGKETNLNLKTTFTRDEHYILRYPLQSGTEWQDTTITKLLRKTGPPQKTEFNIIAEVPVKITIEAIADTIKVPAGTFTDCLRIKKYGSSYKDAGNYIGLTIVGVNETSWYAPGIGLVKSIREETTSKKALDRGELIVELESFSS